jgi:hypothetical protein
MRLLKRHGASPAFRKTFRKVDRDFRRLAQPGLIGDEGPPAWRKAHRDIGFGHLRDLSLSRNLGQSGGWRMSVLRRVSCFARLSHYGLAAGTCSASLSRRFDLRSTALRSRSSFSWRVISAATWWVVFCRRCLGVSGAGLAIKPLSSTSEECHRRRVWNYG